MSTHCDDREPSIEELVRKIAKLYLLDNQREFNIIKIEATPKAHGIDGLTQIEYDRYYTNHKASYSYESFKLYIKEEPADKRNKP